RRRSTVEEKDKGTKTATAAKATPQKKEEKKKDANWTAEGKKQAEEFMKKYADLGVDGIKAEFKKEVEAYQSPQFGHAAFRANPGKNRHKDPPTCLDETRVALPDEKAYINASWTYDLQKIARQYILTQTPLESTVEDFWKMIFEHKVICVVVLCDKTENGQEIMADFWPTNNGDFHNYGQMAVSNKKITSIIQFKAWEATFTQSSARNLLKIIRVISRTVSLQLEAISTGPVVVMDEYSGISRASVITVVDVMAALIYKGDKDKLPDLVKWARRCRNGAIKNEDDYLAVIKTIFEYLY
ncbi:hypothetical protein PMAYCL1PPCAC_17703, partial [Pristionchus mayeri]